MEWRELLLTLSFDSLWLDLLAVPLPLLISQHRLHRGSSCAPPLSRELVLYMERSSCVREWVSTRYVIRWDEMLGDLSSPKWWTSSSSSKSIAPKRNMCRRHDRVSESHFSGWLICIYVVAESAEANGNKVLHKLNRLTVVTIILAFATSWRLLDMSTSPVTSMTL